MQSNYNGALLVGDTLLRVSTKKGEQKAKPLTSLIHSLKKEPMYTSCYKNRISTFYAEKQDEIPEFIYTVYLSSNVSFTCGSFHKSVVYRGDRVSELLPIEFIYSNKNDIYIAHETDYGKSNSIDMAYNSIEEITRIKNDTNIPVYRLWFDVASPSTLLLLDNGIVIRGDKGVKKSEEYVQHKNAV
jgi:hypothetical protein